MAEILGALDRLSGAQRGERRIEIVFVSGARMAALSGRFRGAPRATDVLAFTYKDPDLCGEVAVSLDTAARQARERGVPLTHELILLCVHGLLHISGLRDETFDDWREMKIAEFENVMRILT